MVLAHHVLLVASVLALGAAALRAASALAPGGLERVLVAAVLAATAMVGEALLLGLAGLGASPVALALAAGVTWLVARVALPAPAVPPLDELAAQAGAASAPMRLAIAAAGGVLAVLVVVFLRHPAVGIDGTAYHLPEIVNWIHSGHVGAEVRPSEDFPTGAYPLTHEVLIAWSMGLSRSFVPVAVWPSAMLALFACASWLGLRRLGVGAAVAALAIVAVAVSPPLVGGLNAPKNDLAALTWLVAAAALCVAAIRRPPLLAVAVLAGGLSVGTKTTTAPLVALVLGAALYLSWRRRTPPLPARSLLFGALALAAGVGGVWYVRNLIVHGSPLWPLITTPWGDDVPPAIARLDPSFIDRPAASLDGRTHTYVDGLAGGLVLMAGGMLAWTLSRRRAVLVASAATAFAVFTWARAPFTGIADDRYVDLSLFVIRYLLPAIAVGAMTLALAARGRGVRAWAAVALLGAATVWSVLQSRDIGYPLVPSGKIVVAGALAGAVAGLGAMWVFARGRGLMRATGAVVAVAVAVGLAASAPGYVQRHADTHATFAAPVIEWFAGQKAFRDGDAPISFSPQAIGPLAGDRLQHDLFTIPGRTPCAEVRARARRGFVVVRDLAALTRRYLAPYRAGECLAGERPLVKVADFRVYHLRAATDAGQAGP
ncbi:MAG: hypothetical protein QOG15_1868 [Solirubrobacteraceae bacterium]|nr:hypothetical protein [Solirubrobacteraceae bacterium]